MSSSGWEKLVDLRGEYKIAFRQAVDLVRPQRQFHLAPRQINVGMVVLLLGQFADAIGEIERLAEVWELEFPFQMVFADDLPAWIQLLRERVEIIALERRHAAFAGHTFL